MKISRREFVKAGCFSVTAFAGTALFGCASNMGTNYSDKTSNNTNKESEQSMQTSSNTSVDTDTTSQSGSSLNGTAAVVYFSCTGNTKTVAEKIADATKGQLMRIEPAEPYTPADLDYNSDCRANTEQSSGSARPALAAPVPNITDCSIVYIGYPIWWGKAPRIILTFLESVNVTGKTIVPFCTSGSSPISESIPEIEQAASGATVIDGRRFSSNVSQQEIDSWLNSL